MSGNTITANLNPDANTAVFRAEANKKQDVILRRYMAASSIAQKQMLDSGDLAKELKAAGPAPATGGKIEELYNQQDDNTKSKYKLDEEAGYDQFVEKEVIERCREYNKKGYDKNKREWASTIAAESYNNLKDQGFYKKQGVLEGESKGTRGGWTRGEVGQVRGLRNAGKGNILSNKNTFGKNFTIDPETRAVTARPTGIPGMSVSGKIFNSRKQAKSAFQGLIAAGSMGKPLTFTLDTNDFRLARDQIKQLTEEAVARGVPLDQITIETPGLAGTEPMKLDKIVADAADGHPSQYKPPSFLSDATMTTALDKRWGERMIENGGLDPERTDAYLNGKPYDKNIEADSGYAKDLRERYDGGEAIHDYNTKGRNDNVPPSDQFKAFDRNVEQVKAASDQVLKKTDKKGSPSIYQLKEFANPETPRTGVQRNQYSSFLHQVEKDKQVLKTDIKVQTNKYKNNKKAIAQLDKDIAKLGTVDLNDPNISNLEKKKEEKKSENQGIAENCLDSYNQYKALDNKPDEQIACNNDKNTPESIMDDITGRSYTGRYTTELEKESAKDEIKSTRSGKLDKLRNQSQVDQDNVNNRTTDINNRPPDDANNETPDPNDQNLGLPPGHPLDLN